MCVYVCVCHGCMNQCVDAYGFVCVCVYEMNQQSTLYKWEFSARHNFICIWHYAGYSRPVKLETGSGPNSEYNLTSWAAKCMVILACPQCRKKKRYKIWSCLIVQDCFSVSSNSDNKMENRIWQIWKHEQAKPQSSVSRVFGRSGRHRLHVNRQFSPPHVAACLVTCTAIKSRLRACQSELLPPTPGRIPSEIKNKMTTQFI